MGLSGARTAASENRGGQEVGVTRSLCSKPEIPSLAFNIVDTPE